MSPSNESAHHFGKYIGAARLKTDRPNRIGARSRAPPLNKKQSAIYQEATRRGIDTLMHFTPAPNLPSILMHGLLSIQDLQNKGMAYLRTDQMRLEGRPGAVSLSVHSINESMFAAKRSEYRLEWAIVAIDASVLWTHRCEFSWQNAARASIRGHHGYRGGPWAFREMFEDRPMGIRDPRSTRETLRREERQPTDNAAEVQVLDPIHPDLIRAVAVGNETVQALLGTAMREIGRSRPILVDPHL